MLEMLLQCQTCTMTLIVTDLHNCDVFVSSVEITSCSYLAVLGLLVINKAGIFQFWDLQLSKLPKTKSDIIKVFKVIVMTHKIKEMPTSTLYLQI